MLAIEGLQIRYGSRLLVDGVDLRVRAGETFGLVGESGSGKSLTARAAVGLLPRGITATGSITVGGAQLVGAGEKVLRRLRGNRVGLLMQDPFAMLNPLQTAGQHIAESLPRARRSEVAERLAEVGIDDPSVLKRYPFQLSGGMRQRVALAAALARDPELLIADEPTTALDATIQDEIMRLLARIQRERGMSVLLITHDLRVAFALCDRLAVMYAGRIVERGPARAVSGEPSHPYTAGLLRALPSIERTADRLAGIPGSVPPASEVRESCAFVSRCDQAREECASARPPLREMGADRQTACLFPVERQPCITEDAGRTRTFGPPLLQVTGLRKDYRQVRAVREVSLEVAEGESVGVVGESGSGKTTVARCILGLVTPSGGRIDLGTGLRHRLVQCVFQDPYTSLNPARSIGATLVEAARQGAPEGRMTPQELLELVGLPAAYARRRPAGLSGGERQRVAIARALAVRPALLVCDEPVASLDVSVQAHILELLRRVNRELGTSMLFITHDLAVVRQVTDRLVVMLDGQVVESGPTDQVLDAPEHLYTRQLVSSSEISLER
ncbi:dipeptide ABC transporter ATP-binding protein [Streptosporangium roseum]|uniref:dipeptide ABC transporter ATP-binding protein n=1 Tax=Streptosporangium roseum TaxID=2001 RepID=UPI0004CCDC81|nr:ABC transporter ATP-binding protein [Streptosporangium roseum]